jgi:hypothetical protein
MSAGANNMGLWAENQVRFMIPVKVFRKATDGGREELGFGTFSAFLFSNSALGTTTGRELNGWPSMLAEIVNLPNTWGGTSGPFTAFAPLMQVNVSMPAEVNAGQPFRKHTLLELVDGKLFDDDDDSLWSAAASSWAAPVKQDLERMHAIASSDQAGFDDYASLAMQIFAGRRDINEYSFKQFRDAESPVHACYQAVINSRARIQVKEMRELEHSVHVNIYRYPTQPIVDALGLKHLGGEPGGSGGVYQLAACRPFYFRAEVTTELGEVICWRAGNRNWKHTLRALRPPPAKVPGGDLVRFMRTGHTDLSDSAAFTRDHYHPRELAAKIDAWASAAPDHLFLSREAEHAGLTGPFEPHMILHAALSREWEHRGRTRWQAAADAESRRRANPALAPTVPAPRQLPDFVFPAEAAGSQASALFPEHERVADMNGPGYWTPGTRAEDE